MQSTLDNLTIGEAKQLAAMFAGCNPVNITAAGPERPVLVTTEYRGVFFGYATDTGGDTIKLRSARNCIYWSKAVKGFIGLCVTGPDEDCRIGPAADIELRKITCVADVSPEAVKAWEAAPFSKG
jgi:hypothetical protein